MGKVLCTKCGHALQREESGIIVAELFDGNKQVYKYWSADLFRCLCCETEVVADFADKPLAEHHDPPRMREAEEAAALAKARGRLYEWKEGPC